MYFQDKYCNVHSEVCCRLPSSVQTHPGQGSTFYQHSTSQAASSASASSGSTFTNTYFTNSPSAGGPTVASHIASQYTPSRSNFPDSHPSGTQPGLIHIPPSHDLKPGQTIPITGSDGNSPGLIHVLPEGSTQRPYTSGPGLVHIPPSVSKGQPLPSGGNVDINPNGANPRPFTSGPNYPNKGQSVTPSSYETTFKDVRNDLGFASTIQGPAYLPPDASPTPNTYTPDLNPPDRPGSPSSLNPNVLIPQRATTKYYPSTPKPYYTTPKPYYTTPKPYYTDSSNLDKNYLPPGVTRKPDHQPTDSNIINIDVIRATTTTEPNLRPDSANTPVSRLRPPTSPRTQGELNTTPYPGCAAALKCVEYQFCTADGVISTTPVFLTKEQETLRVPLTVIILGCLSITVV